MKRKLGTAPVGVAVKPIVHTPECKRSMTAWKKAVAKFEREHPGYCHACDGWSGSWYDFDPSPAGVSLSPGKMTDFSTCEKCVESGICPWCGEKLDEAMFERGDLKCSKCEWNGAKEQFGLPPKPECWCGYDAWEERFEEELKKVEGPGRWMGDR